MIEYPSEVLSNLAGELKDTRKKKKEGDMLDVSLFVSQVLQALTVALTIGVVAIWAVVLKETISLFLESFGLKKTVVVATMAFMLLPIATAHAGDTIARIEDGNLVYYEKTKEIPKLPSGITDAEQARQLVEGVIPSVKLSAEEEGFYFGLPLVRIKTDTTILFRGGWITEEVSNESLSVPNVLVIAALMLYAFFTAYTNNSGANFFMVIFFTLLTAVAAFSWDATLTQVVVALWTLSFVSYLPGRYLRRRREKRQTAGHVLTAEPT